MGYGVMFVCLCVCMFVCLYVCMFVAFRLKLVFLMVVRAVVQADEVDDFIKGAIERENIPGLQIAQDLLPFYRTQTKSK
jgi:hypothetical protein